MIIELVTKNELLKFVKNENIGIKRKYLVSILPKSKLDKIVLISSKLTSMFKIDLNIEVKYLLGRREKRIEIVYKDGDFFNICKITNFKEFDKDSIDLMNLLKDIKSNPIYKDYIFEAKLIFSDDFNEEIVKAFILQNKFELSCLQIT
jgi:hypothetical protein